MDPLFGSHGADFRERDSIGGNEGGRDFSLSFSDMIFRLEHDLGDGMKFPDRRNMGPQGAGARSGSLSMAHIEE